MNQSLESSLEKLRVEFVVRFAQKLGHRLNRRRVEEEGDRKSAADLIADIERAEAEPPTLWRRMMRRFGARS